MWQYNTHFSTWNQVVNNLKNQIVYNLLAFVKSLPISENLVLNDALRNLKSKGQTQNLPSWHCSSYHLHLAIFVH
jgi:hypothetical protein